MDFTQAFDAISLDTLRATGATKWAAEDGSIGAFVAEMDFGIAPPITAALHAAVDEGAFGYLPARLTEDLRQATAAMLQARHGWDVPPAQVWPVPDVIKALELAITHHSAPGSKVIVPTPAYMPFLLIPPFHQREVIQVPMLDDGGHYSYDLDALDRAFADGGNLLLMCNPHNPTGRVFTQEELAAVAQVVERHQGRVFADEIWAPLVFPGHKYVPYASVSEAAAGHTITAISASKAWNLPGLKCAQVITSNMADQELWQKIGFFAGHGTSNLGVTANIAAYRDGFPWLDQVLAYLQRNAEALAAMVADKLPGVRFARPEGSYIAWLDFRGTAAPVNPAALFKAQAGVHLTDGASCGAGYEGFVRVILATPLPILTEIVERMAGVMQESASA
ncbi:aminotransferase class I/II-fold pyridoxal phosphate-dependent enzyme [Altererythrobacter xixiisoli]|uniref:cysteine-S-conjugate beta-lyase n=1 Tax=Croceibacterium xixiisoli TaxID=1476466 RepID=A0A6I4TWV2_9SPHN|nr:aminotransferase class I/II-fold pyridoxal phosphate-dependent enzyme [Croceibacterium xixiisoli]MXO99591.1 aminotransferase class I/II-fold pyridoxal phosphate-dependent enzyme [Croceibacterium xixiisoli]